MNYAVYVGKEGVRFSLKATRIGVHAKVFTLRHYDDPQPLGKWEDCASMERHFQNADLALAWCHSQEQDFYETTDQTELEDLVIEAFGVTYL